MDAFGEHDCKFFLCFTFLWFKKPQQNMYRTGSVNSNLNRGYSDIHTLYNRWTILIDSHTPAKPVTQLHMYVPPLSRTYDKNSIITS